jgi:hypothetical protein
MKGEEKFALEEIKRYGVIKSLLDRMIMNKEAAIALQLSKRQIR